MLYNKMETGQGLAEYGLIVLIVIVFVVIAFSFLLDSVFVPIQTSIETIGAALVP